jgi:peptidoglycan/LPS O-acetylase OafA/YrhL
MGRLPTLDGLRGLAAIAVVLFHASLISGWSKPIAPTGYLAVDLFFALSGFVVAGAYAGRLRDGLPVSRFIMLRIARLAPMHMLGQLLGFVLMTAAGLIALGPALAMLGPGLVLLPLPVDEIFPLNGPAWSLFWELAINVAFALLLPLLTIRRLIALTGAAAILLAITGVYFGTLHAGWELPHFIGGLPRVLFSFSMGVVLHHFRHTPRTNTNGAALLCAILITSCLWGTMSWMYDLPVVLIVFPITLWLAAAWQPDGLIASIFRSLGDLSYPLYVLHLPIIYAVAKSLQVVPHAPILEPAVWAATLAGLVLASWWVARLVDLPAQAFLRQWMVRRLAA